MRRKKDDLYIGSYNYKKSRHRRYGNGGNSKTGLYIIVVLVLSIIIGVGTFFFTRSQLGQYNEIKVAQNQLRNVSNTEHNSIITDDKTMDTDIKVDKNDGGDTIDSIESDGEDTSVDVDKIGIGKEKVEDFMPNFVDTRTPVKVKGIYVTGPRAGTKVYMDDLIELVDTTEINAMVIDIKNDSGEITYKMQLEEAIEIKSTVNYIPNIEELIGKLKEKNIYLIARVVAFKDPLLAKNKPELSLKKRDGTIFRDRSGLSWVNPYKKEVWDYLLNISKEAVKLGFDEIQFDYIRFATESGMKDVDFGPESLDKSKTQIITEFTKFVCEELKPLGVYVSADVYGTIIDSKVDAEIVGQDYTEMSKYLDYISPMIYPSHYADGAYGVEHPDTEPYNLILRALNKSKSILMDINNYKNKAIVRPWLQDFTAKWIKNYISYGPEEIRAQIDGVYDAGYEEWILWNGNTNYTKEGLLDE